MDNNERQQKLIERMKAEQKGLTPNKKDMPISKDQNRISKSSSSITKLQGNIIILLLLSALGFPIFGFFKPKPPTPKWEYKITNPIDEIFTLSLDGLGEDGWELVTARRAKGALDKFSYECIFKRQK